MSNYETEKEKLLLEVAEKVKETQDLKKYTEEFEILKSDKLRLINQVQDNDLQINKAKVSQILISIFSVETNNNISFSPFQSWNNRGPCTHH